MTTPDGRFHNVVNAYALGPALLPTIGSPGPMLSGVALARRLGDHLVAPLPPPDLEDGFVWLFDGTAASFGHWLQAGPGSMFLDEDERLVTARPGSDIGLWFFGDRGFADFVLRLQFRIEAQSDNTGVFVRFRDPRSAPPDPVDPRLRANPARIAVHTGFEVQVDDLARDDGADCCRTGAALRHRDDRRIGDADLLARLGPAARRVERLRDHGVGRLLCSPVERPRHQRLRQS